VKRTPARHLRSLALFLVSICAATARAEPDTFGTGTGRDGAFIGFAEVSWVNRYSLVTHALVPGDTMIGVPDSNPFEAGNLVLVLQVTGQPPAPDGGGAIWLDGTHIARFEFGRIGSVGSETSFTLTAPLQKAFDAGRTQVIVVPEFTSVTLGAGRRIEGKPWDGSSGGVIAMLVTGAVNNNGVISADGLGFRGGSYVQDMSGTLACSAMDLVPPQGAQRGEGVAAGRYGPTETGRANVAGAGGGGVCLASGGGGGALFGSGGRGGRSDGVSDGARSVGGNGGTAVVSNFAGQLVFGSGGGAGHGDSTTGGVGGAGGGVVLIRAGNFFGSGSYSANGVPGHSAAGDGASGGGAGGSLQLRAVNDLNCGSATANGGAGGNVALPRRGPGGGGGGGRVLGEGCSISCGMQATGGAAGVQTDAGAIDGAHYGATAGSTGVAMIGSCFLAPATPSITAPTPNATVQTPQLTVAGTAAVGDDVVVSLDGLEVGTTTATNTGSWTYLLQGYGNGAHSVQAAVARGGVQSPRSGAVPFTVDFPKDLAISATNDDFVQGQTDARYVIQLRNVGNGDVPANANISVTITLPAALTLSSVAGDGWYCPEATTFCAPPLSALMHGDAYPPLILTVTVADNAPASVSTGLSLFYADDANAANNTYNAVTVIGVAGDRVFADGFE
jgi:large repetitive protein